MNDATSSFTSSSLTGFVIRSAGMTHGSGVQSTTVASATGVSGIRVPDRSDGTSPLCFAIRVDGFVSTTSDTMLHNTWGLESGMNANAGPTYGDTGSFWGAIEVYTDAGTYRFDLMGAPINTGGEWGTSAAARTSSPATLDARTINTGDWLVFHPFHTSAGGSITTGFTLTWSYSGTTDAANGDTYAQFSNTFYAYGQTPVGQTAHRPTMTQALSH